MLRLVLLCLLPAGGLPAARAQEPSWQALARAPVALNLKHDDLFFTSAATGWLVTRDGGIYRTDDAGASWRRQLQGTAFFRAVGFADSLRGWAGNLRGDGGDVLYQTRDGGRTWSVVPGLAGPKGVCGIYVVDATTVYAVGRLQGPAYLMKTQDGGARWEVIDLRAHAGMLIDAYFWGRDYGIVVGGTSADLQASRTVILATADGGRTWTPRYTSPRSDEWAWKITFPSPSVGYVSIQTRPGTSPRAEYFLKTTDGGRTWQEKVFARAPYSAQGIGFRTPDHGWIGSFSPDRPTLETHDGGETWHEAGFGEAVNRFRFLGDTLAYAAGRTVYRYAPAAPTAHEPLPAPAPLLLRPNYPNPFRRATTVAFSLPAAGAVSLRVFDLLGRPVATLVEGPQPAGLHEAVFDASGLPAGVYVYRLDAAGWVEVRRLVVRP